MQQSCRSSWAAGAERELRVEYGCWRWVAREFVTGKKDGGGGGIGKRKEMGRRVSGDESGWGMVQWAHVRPFPGIRCASVRICTCTVWGDVPSTPCWCPSTSNYRVQVLNVAAISVRATLIYQCVDYQAYPVLLVLHRAMGLPISDRGFEELPWVNLPAEVLPRLTDRSLLGLRPSSARSQPPLWL